MKTWKYCAVSFLFGLVIAWWAATVGVVERDEAVIDYFVVKQGELAQMALDKEDMDGAVLHATNSAEAAKKRGEFLGLAAFPWGIGNALTIPLVWIFRKEGDLDSMRQTEIHAQRNLENILKRQKNGNKGPPISRPVSSE